MANYSTAFSVRLPLPPDEADLMGKIMQETNGFLVVLEGGNIYVTDDNHEGDVEAAAEFIRDYLACIHYGGGIHMSWASWCSRPRVNEARGGAIVCTKDQIYWEMTSSAILACESDGIPITNYP